MVLKTGSVFDGKICMSDGATKPPSFFRINKLSLLPCLPSRIGFLALDFSFRFCTFSKQGGWVFFLANGREYRRMDFADFLTSGQCFIRA